MARPHEADGNGAPADQVTWRIIRPNPLYPRAVRYAPSAEESEFRFLQRWNAVGGDEAVSSATVSRLLRIGEVEKALDLVEDIRLEALRFNGAVSLATFGGLREPKKTPE